MSEGLRERAEPSEEMRLKAVVFAKAYPNLTLGDMWKMALSGEEVRREALEKAAEIAERMLADRTTAFG